MVLKEPVFEKLCKTCRNISMKESATKIVTVFKEAIFFNKVLRQV